MNFSFKKFMRKHFKREMKPRTSIYPIRAGIWGSKFCNVIKKIPPSQCHNRKGISEPGLLKLLTSSQIHFIITCTN